MDINRNRITESTAALINLIQYFNVTAPVEIIVMFDSSGRVAHLSGFFVDM